MSDKICLAEFINRIDKTIKHNLKTSFYSDYSFIIDKSLRDKNPYTVETLIFSDERLVVNTLKDDEFEFEYKREFEVIWKYEYDDFFDKVRGHQRFLFEGIGYINVTERNYTFELIDPIKKQLYQLQKTKIHTSKEYNIVSLRSYRSDFIQEDAFNVFLDVCRSTTSIKPFQDFHSGLDLIYTNEHIAALISELILYRPYIYDITQNRHHFEGRTIYTYFPTFYDRQYISLASQILQELYNFWDKIGDLLDVYFETKLSERQVGFPLVIERLRDNVTSAPFEWLKNFKDTEFAELNDQRKEIVHYTGLESKFYKRFNDSYDDEERAQELQKWKDGLVNYLIKSLEYTLQGYEEALKLIQSK